MYFILKVVFARTELLNVSALCSHHLSTLAIKEASYKRRLLRYKMFYISFEPYILQLWIWILSFILVALLLIRYIDKKTKQELEKLIRKLVI